MVPLVVMVVVALVRNNEYSGPGGDGLKEVTISGTLYNFASVFGATYGEVISGESWFAGGGGGGGNGSGGIGGKGGGGDGVQVVLIL
jgi:hypothetical protein